MPARWMQQKMGKLREQRIAFAKDEAGKVHVDRYKSSRPSRKQPMRAPVDPAALQALASAWNGKVKKLAPGCATYARSTFRKGSGVCARGTWGRN